MLIILIFGHLIVVTDLVYQTQNRTFSGRCGDCMDNALIFGSRDPDFSPNWVNVYSRVLRHATLLSQCLSPTRSINGWRRIVKEA